MGAPELPEGLEYVRTTPTFDNASVPAGLLRAHRVAPGVWGRLLVHAGALVFVFEDEPDAPVTVAAGATIAIPPDRLHHVELPGPARFAIEFHRIPETTPVHLGRESDGIRSPDEEEDR